MGQMNEHWKNVWTKALRSGAYTQTSGTLRDGEGFCCLGVLCDLYRREMSMGCWNENGMEADEVSFNFEIGNKLEISTLPAIIKKNLGISTEVIDTLVTMNDDQRADFHEIARYIDSEL